MPQVQSGRELYTQLQRLLGGQHGNGWACPWCKQLGVYEMEDETTSDRLFLSTKRAEGRHPIRFVCRQANEGLVNHSPVHDVEELFSEFDEAVILTPGHTWDGIAAELQTLVGVSAGPRDIDASKVFWNYLQVIEHHAHPATYDAWAKVGFSSTTVDKLMLGVLPNGRLSIPIPYLATVEPFGMRLESDSYVQRSRAAEGTPITKFNPKYYWPGHGALPVTLWYVAGEEKNPCRIVEGDTSFIAANEIWSNGTTATTMGGAGSWTVAMSEYLLARGHHTFHIYTDNDQPGRKYAASILESFKLAAEKRGDDWTKLIFLIVRYPEDTPEKYDPRKALLEHGVQEARKLLESWIESAGEYKNSLTDFAVGRVHAEWDGEYARNEFEAEYAEEKGTLYDLQELRGPDGRGRIYREIDGFISNYKLDEEGRGRLLLIRSTPGVGKTRSAVRYAEDFAKKYVEKRERSVARAITRLEGMEQTEKVVKKLEDLRNERYKKLCVVFVGAFVDGFDDLMQHATDEDLWFNFSARNTTTCQNTRLVEEIANAGYPIMRTACIEGGMCPLRDACLGRINGELQYLAQLEEVKYHPIVYLRHNHLYMESILKMAHLVIVDEDPSSVALNAVTLTANELKQFDAHVMLDGEEASIVNNLVDALIKAIEMWSLDELLMGRSLVDRLLLRRGFRTLHESALYIVQYGLLDKIASWRPHTLAKAPDGRIVRLLELIVRDILREEEDWNGQIFIESNTVTFYPMEPFRVDQRKPVVALDATGMAHKYQLCFNRPVPEFFAEVFPAHQKTFVVTNTENTMTTLHSGVHAPEENTVSLYGVRDSMTVAVRAKPQNLALLNDLNHVPNSAMKQALKMTLGLTAQHGQLLVVTYRTARQFMEKFVTKHFPDYAPYIGWGHFRALRGLNVFENMPAVLVIGTFRVPISRLHKDLIAFHKDDPELLDLSPVRVDEYYHYTPWRYSTLTVGDARPTVQAYLHELEAGEIQQVAGRIRAAVANEDKYVYLMTARPAMPWMTYTHRDDYDPDKDRHFSTAQSAAWWWYEAEQSMSYIVQFYNQHGRRPSIRELKELTGQTEWAARKMLAYWDEVQGEQF